MWLTLATVDEIGYDGAEGIFVDVTYVPSGEPETALLGGPYAGPNAGMYFPVSVGDTVLVAVPNGDTQMGPIIIQRIWSASDKPPEDAVDSDDDQLPTSDVLLRVIAGQRFIVRTSGDEGGGVDIGVEGKGDLILATGEGKIKLERGADQDLIRGNDYADAQDDFLTSLKTFVTAIENAGLDPQGGLLGASVVTAAGVFAPQIDTFKEAKETYLSKKVVCT